MTLTPKPQEIYKHFKGNRYRIITIAEHSETGELMVVYRAMYGECKTYVRPLEMFLSKVDKDKYPEAEQEYRFELQSPQAAEAQEEENGPDPLVLEFLDADTYEERLNILAALHHRITDEMITTMALASNVEVREGDIESRYAELKNCLLTLDKYECSRVR